MHETLPIKHWPMNDRPRERILNAGVQALSDAELIAVLLGTGQKGKSAVVLALQVLERFQGLFRLGKCSPLELSGINGIGSAKAAKILAACELGRRRERHRPEPRTCLRSAADAAQLAASYLRDLSREGFLVILLDHRHQLLHPCMLALGSADQVPVSPRELFQLALQYQASAMILAHNHPSGDPTPSASDVALTEQIASGAKLLGIRLLDHVIIGTGSYRSLNEEGLFRPDAQTTKDTTSDHIQGKGHTSGILRGKQEGP